MTTIRLYSKPPIAGATKSRLARTIGDAAAASLHAAFLEDLAVRFGGSGFRTVLDVTELHPVLVALASRYGLGLATQCDGDLGVRMRHSIAETLRDDDRVVVLGSDLPTIALADVERAVVLLDEADVVFGPTADGGYGLVGARAEVSFESVRWSTEHALADSVASVERAGLGVAFGPTLLDVDDEADLRTLDARLARDPSLAPHTAAALAAIARGAH